jgi:hypothetical protein
MNQSNETKKSLKRRRAGDVRQNRDSTREGTVFNIIGLSFLFLVCLSFLRFVLFYFLSIHCIELPHASHVFIFESTHKLLS